MFNKDQKSEFDGKYRAKKRHVSKLGLYVIFSISFVVLYTIAVLVNFVINGVEPSTLTKYVYGFFAGEVVVSGLIKLFNITLIERNKPNLEDSEEVCE